LLIQHLTRNVTEAHLHEIFGVYGTLDRVFMPKDRRSGMHRGEAILDYAEVDDAKRAIAHMHQGQLDGAVLSVSV
ncbi:MAG: hypothetical protein DHS80DRAFT_9182, partial [Piptocephalis tieghemiana]